MWETRSVEMVVDLPEDLADDLEKLQREDPDYLRRVLRYGLTRRLVYRTLRESFRDGAARENGTGLDSDLH